MRPVGLVKTMEDVAIVVMATVGVQFEGKEDSNVLPLPTRRTNPKVKEGEGRIEGQGWPNGCVKSLPI